MCEFHPQWCQKQICGTRVRHGLYHGETMLEEVPGCFLPFINPSESGSPTLSVSKETKPHKRGTVWTQEFIAVGGSQQWPLLFYVPHNPGTKKKNWHLCSLNVVRPMAGTDQQEDAEMSHEHGFQETVQWPDFLSWKGKTQPAQRKMRSHVWSGKEAEPRRPRLPTVVERLKHSTDQPDNSPQTATGLQEVGHACVSTLLCDFLGSKGQPIWTVSK